MSKEREIDYFFVISNLANLDFNLEALFLCIRFTLAALSKAEKMVDKFLALGVFLAVFSAFFKADSLLLLRAVLILSFLTFLIADFIIGI